MKFILSLFLAYIVLSSCANGKSEDDIAGESVEQFAEAYFNYDLNTALKHCTPESKPWIEYTATAIGDGDIEILRAKQDKAETSTEDIIFDGNDSTGTTTVAVRNYLCLDTIGKPGRIVERASLKMRIVKRDGRWLVDLRTAFPLQNGTLSRD